MNLSQTKLPSNLIFGYFFTLVFILATTYFFIKNLMPWAYFFAAMAIIFFVLSFVKADLLLPLNKAWMSLGILLGKVFSPIIIGFIFFGIFCPIATVMRLKGKDELNTKFKNKTSYWILKDKSIKKINFKQQF